MLPGIGPGVGANRLAQCWIILKEFRFAHPQPVQLHEKPNGNTGSDDAWLSAANLRVTIDPG